MTRYRIADATAFTVQRSGMVETNGLPPVSIPVDVYRVLLEFVEGRTFEEVYAEVESDATFEEFCHGFLSLVDAGVLCAVPDEARLGARLRAVWNKRIFENDAVLARMKAGLRDERPIVIRDAFDTGYADDMHRELSEYRGWAPYAGSSDDFHFRHHNIYDLASYPPLLRECRQLFDTRLIKDLVGELTDKDTLAPVALAASYYAPGDYSLPHEDLFERRSVAFVWHLTRDWQQSWGGQLFWCPSSTYVRPSFNTLILFTVTPRSTHFVCPVSAYAQGKRLAVNGWWNRSTAAASAAASAPPHVRERSGGVPSAPLEITGEGVV